MRALAAADLALMRTAAFVDLASREDRKRSAALLADLFVDMNRASPPEVAIEVGAREGTFARRVRRAAPDAAVFAFEANPYCYRRFGLHDRWQRLDVDYLHLAVSDTDGEAVFHILRERNGRQVAPDAASHSLSTRLSDSEYEEVAVQSTKLDTFLAERELVGKPTSLWIDVEGANGKVLAGAERTLQDVGLLLCEVESRAKWDDQWLWPDVHSHLSDCGFVAVARDFEFTTQFNVVFVRDDRLDELTPQIESFHSALAHRAAFDE